MMDKIHTHHLPLLLFLWRPPTAASQGFVVFRQVKSEGKKLGKVLQTEGTARVRVLLTVSLFMPLMPPVAPGSAVRIP